MDLNTVFTRSGLGLRSWLGLGVSLGLGHHGRDVDPALRLVQLDHVLVHGGG